MEILLIVCLLYRFLRGLTYITGKWCAHCSVADIELHK